MTKMTILRGISGSGKSTWARQQNAIVVSRDDLRATFFSNFTSEEYYKSPVLRHMENSITGIQDATIVALLKEGRDVIVDNTNIEWRYVKALAKIAYRHGAEVEVKVFDVPWTIALYRDEGRRDRGGRFVGREVIMKQYDRFKSNKSMTLDPVHEFETYSHEEGLEFVWLCDIDGTVAHHNDARSPFDWKNVGLDTGDEAVIRVIESLDANGDRVIFLSGRDGSCRQETIDWLDENIYTAERPELYMRNAGDMRPDFQVKAELFNDHIRGVYNVMGIFDDRRQVVDLWQRAGLKVFNVAGIDGGDF